METHSPNSGAPRLSAELLDRWLSGDCRASEVREVEIALERDATLRAFVDELRAMRFVGARLGSAYRESEGVAMTDRAWSALRQRLDEVDTDSPVRRHLGVESERGPRNSPKSVPAVRQISRAKSWRAAAAAIAIVIGGALGYRLLVQHSQVATEHQYATGFGERVTVTLPDGSQATLAPQSSMHIPGDFGEQERGVVVQGEVFFDIKPNAQKAFSVRAGKVIARVLGTSFDVRHFAGDTVVQVAVVTGKVAVGREEHGGNGIPLVRGQVARIADSTITISITPDVAPFSDWTTGKLTFADAKVGDVLSTLSRWYGYQFQVADSALVSQHLSASFDQKSGEEILAALKAALGVEMTISGRVITLRKARRAVAAPTRIAPDSFILTHSGVGR